MNFIIASLVYHCNSIVAFWLFTALMEDYQLRENYIPGFEGMHVRSKEIADIIKKRNVKMHAFLVSPPCG